MAWQKRDVDPISVTLKQSSHRPLRIKHGRNWCNPRFHVDNPAQVICYEWDLSSHVSGSKTFGGEDDTGKLSAKDIVSSRILLQHFLHVVECAPKDFENNKQHYGFGNRSFSWGEDLIVVFEYTKAAKFERTLKTMPSGRRAYEVVEREDIRRMLREEEVDISRTQWYEILNIGDFENIRTCRLWAFNVTGVLDFDRINESLLASYERINSASRDSVLATSFGDADGGGGGGNAPGGGRDDEAEEDFGGGDGDFGGRRRRGGGDGWESEAKFSEKLLKRLAARGKLLNGKNQYFHISSFEAWIGEYSTHLRGGMGVGDFDFCEGNDDAGGDMGRGGRGRSFGDGGGGGNGDDDDGGGLAGLMGRFRERQRQMRQVEEAGEADVSEFMGVARGGPEDAGNNDLLPPDSDDDDDGDRWFDDEAQEVAPGNGGNGGGGGGGIFRSVLPKQARLTVLLNPGFVLEFLTPEDVNYMQQDIERYCSVSDDGARVRWSFPMPYVAIVVQSLDECRIPQFSRTIFPWLHIYAMGPDRYRRQIRQNNLDSLVKGFDLSGRSDSNFQKRIRSRSRRGRAKRFMTNEAGHPIYLNDSGEEISRQQFEAEERGREGPAGESIQENVSDFKRSLKRRGLGDALVLPKSHNVFADSLMSSESPFIDSTGAAGTILARNNQLDIEQLSTLSGLRKEFEYLRDDWTDKTPAAQQTPEELKKLKRAFLSTVIQRRFNNGRNVSNASKAYMTFMRSEEFQRWSIDPDLHKNLVKEMSPANNMRINEMTVYEYIFLISMTHDKLFGTMLIRLDASRKKSGLHGACLDEGPSASSKSFNYDLMELMSVVGTVVTLQYSSSKSDAVDGDDDGLITVMHEAPIHLFVDNDFKPNPEAAALRERMTSGQVRAKILAYTADGRREQQYIHRSTIGVWFMATNRSPEIAGVDEATLSRFYRRYFTSYNRKHHDIMAKIMDSSMQTRDHKKLRNYYITYFRVLQAFTHYIFECIYIGVIEDVSLDVASRVGVGALKAALERHGLPEPHTRVYERWMILTRLCVIKKAFDTVFVQPGRLHTCFRLQHLVDVEPYLYDDVDTVVFTYGFIRDDVIDPQVTTVIDGLKRLAITHSFQFACGSLGSGATGHEEERDSFDDPSYVDDAVNLLESIERSQGVEGKGAFQDQDRVEHAVDRVIMGGGDSRTRLQQDPPTPTSVPVVDGVRRELVHDERSRWPHSAGAGRNNLTPSEIGEREFADAQFRPFGGAGGGPSDGYSSGGRRKVDARSINYTYAASGWELDELSRKIYSIYDAATERVPSVGHIKRVLLSLLKQETEMVHAYKLVTKNGAPVPRRRKGQHSFALVSDAYDIALDLSSNKRRYPLAIRRNNKFYFNVSLFVTGFVTKEMYDSRRPEDLEQIESFTRELTLGKGSRSASKKYSLLLVYDDHSPEAIQERIRVARSTELHQERMERGIGAMLQGDRLEADDGGGGDDDDHEDENGRVRRASTPEDVRQLRRENDSSALCEHMSRFNMGSKIDETFLSGFCAKHERPRDVLIACVPDPKYAYAFKKMRIEPDPSKTIVRLNSLFQPEAVRRRFRTENEELNSARMFEYNGEIDFISIRERLKKLGYRDPTKADVMLFHWFFTWTLIWDDNEIHEQYRYPEDYIAVEDEQENVYENRSAPANSVLPERTIDDEYLSGRSIARSSVPVSYLSMDENSMHLFDYAASSSVVSVKDEPGSGWEPARALGPCLEDQKTFKKEHVYEEQQQQQRPTRELPSAGSRFRSPSPRREHDAALDFTFAETEGLSLAAAAATPTTARGPQTFSLDFAEGLDAASPVGGGGGAGGNGGQSAPVGLLDSQVSRRLREGGEMRLSIGSKRRRAQDHFEAFMDIDGEDQQRSAKRQKTGTESVDDFGGGGGIGEESLLHIS